MADVCVVYRGVHFWWSERGTAGGLVAAVSQHDAVVLSPAPLCLFSSLLLPQCCRHQCQLHTFPGVSVVVFLMIMIIIIAFKGTSRDFLSLLTAPRTVSNMYTKVAPVQSCANYVQHIECLSLATCCVTYHVVQRNSSATRFDRV